MKTTIKLHIKMFLLVAFLWQQANAQETEETYSGSSQSHETRTINTVLPLTSTASRVEVDVIDGLAIFQGDIVLGRVDEIQSGGRGGTAITADAYKWPNGIIPYEIPSGDQRDSLVVVQAVTEMTAQTNLTLRPKTASDTDYIRFNLNSSGYSSPVGKSGGPQNIRITNNPRKGKIMHEICHSAGMYHEQSRTDRDTHVRVDTMNVIVNKRKNFRIYTQSSLYATRGGTDVGSYDYGSIMHYPKFSSFAIDPSTPIITPIPTDVPIGQRTALSAGDIAAINSIYPSSSSSSSSSSSTTPSTTPGTSSTSDTNSSLNITYAIQLVPQTTDVSCWAASAAMIVGWRDQISIEPRDIARGLNGWRNYFYNGGLPPDNVDMFHHWGLQYEYPQSYTVQGFADLLAVGPLWVATDLNNNPHVVVVAGIQGDGTPEGTLLTIYDPWEQGMTRYRASNRGSTYQETYQQFVTRQERLATRELSEPSAFYIAY